MVSGPEGFVDAGCDYTNCAVTEYSDAVTVEQFREHDAVLFHLEDFVPWPWDVDWVNRVRLPHQR